MEEVQKALAGPDEEMGLLDLLVVVAENIKLLILGPLVVGCCALGAAFLMPQTFESVAVLQAQHSTAALVSTTAVLDPVIASLNLDKESSIEDARSKLRGQIKTVVSRNDNLLTLTVSADTAEQAQAIASALLKQTFRESKPKGSLRGRLEARIAEAQGRFRNAQIAADGLLKRLEKAPSASSVVDMASGYAELLNAAGAAQKEISDLGTQIDGVNDSHLIQAPTRPQKASYPPKGIIAFGAVVVTGLLLLVFMLMRQMIRNSTDPKAAVKLARIRQSLGLG
ncbi:MAG: Wzz/FepE/Etk N-terminal domain-containing protein [Alphaproteobacteria bacterium]|nr:Wzz/FepE/Etk N-terminal domain-containing protein [Alphaproteobacteria bacterium]